MTSMPHRVLAMPSTLFRAALALLLAAVWSAPARAADTDAGREVRPVAGFDRIVARGAVDLTVRQANAEALTLHGPAEVLALIETTVADGTLTIAPKKGARWRMADRIRATVDVVRLKAVETSGSGDVHIGALSTPELSLALSGSGGARLSQLDTGSLALRISGSGDVHADGRAAALAIRIAGSGDVRADGLSSDDVTIRIAGSGDAAVTANRRLEVSIAGSGDVRYSGAPESLKTSVAGSGSVRRK